jgi:hypothetical protein
VIDFNDSSNTSSTCFWFPGELFELRLSPEKITTETLFLIVTLVKQRIMPDIILGSTEVDAPRNRRSFPQHNQASSGKGLMQDT